MKKFIIFSLFLSLLVPTVLAQTKKFSYIAAYETNKVTKLRIAKELQLNRKSPEVINYLEKHPVLVDLKDFSSRKKYSLILSTVIRDRQDDDEYVVFILKNGKEYKIKRSKLLDTPLDSAKEL